MSLEAEFKAGDLQRSHVRYFPVVPGKLEFALELRQLQSQPADTALLWKHGLGPAMANAALRLTEIRNWLEQQVIPRCQHHD